MTDLGRDRTLNASVHQNVRAGIFASDAIHLAADVDALRARLHPHELAVECAAIDL